MLAGAGLALHNRGMPSDDSMRELMDRVIEVVERNEQAFERNTRAFERNTRVYDQNVRAWGETTAAMVAVRKSLEDLGDDMRAHTRGLLQVLDRLDDSDAQGA